MELNIEYPTHHIILSKQDDDVYTKAKILVLGDTYNQMVTAIIADKSKVFNFVQNERILLNNFTKSLISFHNNQDNILFPQFLIFGDEEEYYINCIVNDIQFEEQSWFNTVYIKTDIYTALIFLKNASTKLLRILYPDLFNPPVNLLEKAFREIEEQKKQFKCDPKIYQSFLEANEIDSLYHFTSRKNVESIESIGILSIQALKKKGIIIDHASTNVSQYVDAKKGLADYVHLGYEPRHPMLMNALAKGVIRDYKVFSINPIVIFYRHTLYSNCNAIRKDAKISSEIKFFLDIPFKKFHKKNYFHLTEEEKELYKSEVLVKSQIDKSLITNI